MTDHYNVQQGIKKDDKKRMAAYALNMCTVSVSQIVDYNDVYILEQEYEAILNNLNLEVIPKDEALLSILKELLNTITFFRIQEMKKAQLEKEYQNRMKNAIWAAIPNMSIFVPGVDPATTAVTVGISLITQVGTGYMNYRKEKAQAKFEKEKQNLELEIAAVEQFNALRRELFTTAWRLASTYNYPDEWRLTERQIKRYNEILMDTDEIRKYERLESIAEHFEAYPPFWYFMGHTANYIATSKTVSVPYEVKREYEKKAIKCFEKYQEKAELNILREDQIRASFDMEYADILIREGNGDTEKVASLLDDAVKISGYSNDTMQISAMTYLKIGHWEEAAKLLRRLVNENYNSSTNAKILSRIYVIGYLRMPDKREQYRKDYESLVARIRYENLFPMPQNMYYISNDTDRKLVDQYMESQKEMLTGEYMSVIDSFEQKYIQLFVQILPCPLPEIKTNVRKETSDIEQAHELFNTGSDRLNDFIENLRHCNFRSRCVDLLNQTIRSLSTLRAFSEYAQKDRLIDSVKDRIISKADVMKRLRRDLESGYFSLEEYVELRKTLSYRTFADDFINGFKDYIAAEWEKTLKDMGEMNAAEFELVQFCDREGIELPDILQEDDMSGRDDENYDYAFSYGLLGGGVWDEKAAAKREKTMLQHVQEKAEVLISSYRDKAKVRLLLKETQEFESYFRNRKLSSSTVKYDALAVLDDTSVSNLDLILLTQGVRTVKNNKIQPICKYDDIVFSIHGSKPSLTIDAVTFDNKEIDMQELWSLIEILREDIRE